ncbi:MAG: carboxypeptidase regulatory-like domain-containing protein [Acidobacteria bacterium]|nr:carboxypeptidase regulatory-like domain-containing protein [Acidobacteriota bacterium]
MSRFFLRLLAVSVVSCLPVCAQVTTGTILGVIRDSSGANVAGAQITIMETNKGTMQRYVTDESGTYNAPFLVPGTYSVAVEKEAFKRQVRSGVILEVDQKARIDFMLEVGQVSETVNVEAIAPLVKSESSELGEVIGERAVRELPLNGRNFAQLVYLAPGVTAGQVGENLSGASTFNPRAGSNFNALGHHGNSNGWLIDGIDNNEYTFNTVIVQPSIESVREFKVLTGVYSAEFGRGAGVVSVSTKSGTNEFHGTMFNFLRNDLLDAKNYYAAPTQKKAPLRRNQFGGAVSGPVLIPKLYNGKNKTHFFADYFGLREIRGLTFVNTVPTDLVRNGNFTQYERTPGSLIRVYDPLTTRLNPNFNPGAPVSASNSQFLRDPFAGNIIPQNRLNPVGRNVAGVYPLPNQSGNFNNYTINANREVGDNGVTGRLDHRFNEKDSVFVRYQWELYTLIAPQGQANCCLPTPPEAAAKFELGPYVAGFQNTRLTTQGAALNNTYVFKPNLLYELRLGFARTNPYTVASDYGKNAATSLGIQGVNISPLTSGIPGVNVQDFTGLSGGPGFLPVNPRQTHYQVDNNFFWTLGRHGIKFGQHYIRRQTSPYTNTSPRGTLSFNNNFTNDPTNNTGGSGMATLLTGYVGSGSRGALLEPYYQSNNEFAFFVQDDLKVNRKLTLNIGVRYEIYTPDVEIRDRLVNVDRTALKLVYAGEDGVSRSANKSTQYGNIGPRFGFAYDLFGHGKTVLRGGYGLSYFPEPVTANGQLGIQVPYLFSQNYTTETNPTDFSRVPQIQLPFPPVQTVKPKTTAEYNAANPSAQGHDYNNLTGYAEHWSFNIEQQLTPTLLLETAYAGSRGIHVMINLPLNEVQPGIGSQPSRRLIQPLNNITATSIFAPRNMSTYHSLQAKAVKRFSQGLQFLFSYSYAKALDFGGSAGSGGGSTGGPQTITCIGCGRGASGYDIKHRGVVSYYYELPFGRGKRWLGASRALDLFVGGWQVSGITTLSTGRPFNVGLATGVNNGAPSWPNRTGPGTLTNPDPYYWFNASDFVAPPANTYGNVARGVLYAPGMVNFDTSFVKNFTLKESMHLQFRVEAFNLFNTPAFGFPNSAIGSPTVGRITSTIGDNRDMQFALKFEF